MQRYDSYKPSDVEWIGQIPSHWEVRRAKYLGKTLNGLTYKPINVTGVDSGVLVLRASNIQNGKLAFEDNVFVDMLIPPELMVQTNDIIICSTNGSLSLVGKLAIVNSYLHATFGSFMLLFRNSPYQQFSLYMLKVVIPNYKALFTTTTINQLTKTTFGNMFCPLPPLEEQERIAEYLDRRCAEVDGIITKEEQAITLLDELKQTIISEAVTYGLDPAIPLKPSGVDWIGQIPNHWEVRRLKYVVSCNDEVLSEMTPPSSVVNYVEISDVTYIKGIKGSTEYEFKDAPSRARRITRVNDVIISTVRTYLKAIARVNEPDVIVSTGFAVLRAQSIGDLYLSYVVKSSGFIDDVVANSFGVTYPSITASKLISLSVPLPPLEEQERIAEYLDRRCEEIDEAKERKQRQIELLREMKQTMISDAVTGRVKVF